MLCITAEGFFYHVIGVVTTSDMTKHPLNKFRLLSILTNKDKLIKLQKRVLLLKHRVFKISNEKERTGVTLYEKWPDIGLK